MTEPNKPNKPNKPTELANGIFYFESLIPDDICNSLIRDTAEQDWISGGKKFGLRDIYDYESEHENKISKIEEFQLINLKALNKVLDIYRALDADDKIPEIIDNSFAFVCRFVRYRTGGSFSLHFDSIARKQSITVVSYLNDNYEGGELDYPRHGISVKPKKGSTLIHPASFAYPHSVNKVTEGRKYICLTAFDLFSKRDQNS